MRNTPDDWDNYYCTCPDCGNRYHASEGYCPCEDEEDEEDEAPESWDEEHEEEEE